MLNFARVLLLIINHDLGRISLRISCRISVPQKQSERKVSKRNTKPFNFHPESVLSNVTKLIR